MPGARGHAILAGVPAEGTFDVYLVRHAFAAHADHSRWPDDSKRPLTEDGIRRFELAARGLRRLVADVDRVLSSGYARAWQTAELLHEHAGWPAPEECEALEAERPASAALPVLRDHDGGSVALVGHEPYLSSLASILCAGGEDTLQLELKKGAVARLEVRDGAGPGSAYLRWAVAPKILRALDRAAR
jgi:phosphohistidine phosphatase